MNLTFTDIHWHDNETSSIFNMHAIKSITLDTDKDVVTIECINNTYKSPYCNFKYGGGITHYEFTCMHPYNINSYIAIVIFEFNGHVRVINESLSIPEYFKNKCKYFCI